MFCVVPLENGTGACCYDTACQGIGIVAAACAGCYKVIWSLFAAGAVSWLFGRIGRGIAKIESYPWDLMDY